MIRRKRESTSIIPRFIDWELFQELRSSDSKAEEWARQYLNKLGMKYMPNLLYVSTGEKSIVITANYYDVEKDWWYKTVFVIRPRQPEWFLKKKREITNNLLEFLRKNGFICDYFKKGKKWICDHSNGYVVTIDKEGIMFKWFDEHDASLWGWIDPLHGYPNEYVEHIVNDSYVEHGGDLTLTYSRFIEWSMLFNEKEFLEEYEKLKEFILNVKDYHISIRVNIEFHVEHRPGDKDGE